MTSPESLDLTLPYFGDHRLFEDVSTHELAHEFTIQKLMHRGERGRRCRSAPLMQMPLWFIEGLAEYYAKRGLDPEAEVLVRDLMRQPDDDGYVLGDFFEDRFTDGLWTYKVGQARCAFLEETYGKGTIQRILEESPRLVSLAQPRRRQQLSRAGRRGHRRPSRPHLGALRALDQAPRVRDAILEHEPEPRRHGHDRAGRTAWCRR